MNKPVLLIVLASGFLAVLLGAFGAHALKNMVPLALLDTWKTASFYHFVHTLALMALIVKQIGSPLKAYQFKMTSYAFITGMILFSGSLYGYVLSGFKPLVFITPVGGFCLLFAWLYWFWCELKN